MIARHHRPTVPSFEISGDAEFGTPDSVFYALIPLAVKNAIITYNKHYRPSEMVHMLGKTTAP